MSDEMQQEVAHRATATVEADSSMEYSVLQSLCDVSIQGRELLADYLRFTGRIRCAGRKGLRMIRLGPRGMRYDVASGSRRGR